MCQIKDLDQLELDILDYMIQQSDPKSSITRPLTTKDFAQHKQSK